MPGSVVLFVAAFLFSLTGICNRLAGDAFGPGMLLFISAASAAIVFFAVLVVAKKWRPILKSDRRLLVFRGALLAIDFPAFFIAVNNIELGLALLAFNASSIITNFLYGRFFLGDNISKREFIGLTLALVGLVIVNIDNIGDLRLLYIVPAMISGMAFSLNGVTSKKLSGTYSEIQINALTYGMGALLAPIVLFLTSIVGIETVALSTSASAWFGAIGFGLLASIAFFLVIYGFKRIDVQKGGLILLSELVFTFIIGWMVYGEGLLLNDWIGAALIIAALALPNMKKPDQEKIVS